MCMDVFVRVSEDWTLHTNIKHEQLYLFLLVFSFPLVIIHQMGNRVS